MYNVNEFLETKLYTDLYLHIVDLAQKTVAVEKNRNLKFSEKEIYLKDVFHFVQEIENKIKDLDACFCFIKSFPNRTAIRKLLTRSEYIIYHLEYYYIGIISIFDRMLKLVNFIYGLGLTDKYTTYDILIQNANVDKTTKKSLKLFYDTTVNIRKIQNHIKHKEKFWDPKLYKPDLFESMYTGPIKEQISKDEIKQYKTLAKMHFKIYITEKKKNIKKTNESIKYMLTFFYNCLYQKNRENLDSFNE